LLFTDLVSSTELLQRAGDEQTQRILRAHRLVLQQAVAIHAGSEVKWLGDGLMSAFASPADAVRCAVAMQQAARRRGRSGGIRSGCTSARRGAAGRVLRTPVVVAYRLCDHARRPDPVQRGGAGSAANGVHAFRTVAL
jgi:class 3 adenylate cyclase